MAAPPDLLDGCTVGITADRRWEEQASLFERRGARVVHGPTLKTVEDRGRDELEAATDSVIAAPPPFLIANTGIGMRTWFAAADGWGRRDELVGALRAGCLVARGPKASRAVHEAGLDVEVMAANERFAETVDLVLERLQPGDRVAVQADGGGLHPDAARLVEAGAVVIEVPLYEWRLPDDTEPARHLAEAVIERRIDAVTFTAAPQIRNWFAIAADDDLDGPLRDALASGDIVVGCVGVVCSEAAVRAGIPADRQVVPEAGRLAPLVRAVTDALIAR